MKKNRMKFVEKKLRGIERIQRMQETDIMELNEENSELRRIIDEQNDTIKEVKAELKKCEGYIERTIYEEAQSRLNEDKRQLMELSMLKIDMLKFKRSFVGKLIFR